MCVVSMIGDYYKDKWADPDWPRPRQPYIVPYPYIQPPIAVPQPKQPSVVPLTEEQIVKRAVEITKRAANEQAIEEQTETTQRTVSRDEFEQLKQEVAEMRELLIRAKRYDETNNEPDCEVEDKMRLLRQVAEAVGVRLEDVIGKKND